MTDGRARLKDIIARRSFGRGEVTLASGRKSDFYFNMKPTMLCAEGAALLTRHLLEAVGEFEPQFVGGLEMGAVPLVGAIAAASFDTKRPLGAVFVRKKAKDHGARLAIEGLAPGETLEGRRVVVVEDVTTTGESAETAAAAMEAAGAVVVAVVTIVDRQEGASQAFAARGRPFKALFTASEFLAA